MEYSDIFTCELWLPCYYDLASSNEVPDGYRSKGAGSLDITINDFVGEFEGEWLQKPHVEINNLACKTENFGPVTLNSGNYYARFINKSGGQLRSHT